MRKKYISRRVHGRITGPETFSGVTRKRISHGRQTVEELFISGREPSYPSGR